MRCEISPLVYLHLTHGVSFMKGVINEMGVGCYFQPFFHITPLAVFVLL